LNLVFGILFIEFFYSYSAHAIKSWFLKLEGRNLLRIIFLLCFRCFLRLILSFFLYFHEVSKIVICLEIEVSRWVHMLNFSDFQRILILFLAWPHSIVMKQPRLVWVSPVWHPHNGLVLRVHVHGIFLEIPPSHIECQTFNPKQHKEWKSYFALDFELLWPCYTRYGWWLFLS
jgi:hypothetical protein